MKKRIISLLLTGCLVVCPFSSSAQDVDISSMTLEELQQAYLELQDKYNELLESNQTDNAVTDSDVTNSVETGDLVFSLINAVQCSSIPGYFEDETPDKPENVFLIINMEAQNNGPDDDYINSFYNSGYVDGYAIDPATLIIPDHEEFSGDIASGRKRTGSIIFEISSEWKEFEYVYQDKSDNIKASFIITPDSVIVE